MKRWIFSLSRQRGFFCDSASMKPVAVLLVVRTCARFVHSRIAFERFAFATSVTTIVTTAVFSVAIPLHAGPLDWLDQKDEDFPPSFEEIKKDYQPSERVLLDRNGVPIDEMRTDATIRRLEWTKLEDVSPAFREALLKSEDKRFFEHSGVDWLALASAAVRMPFSDRPRGASTISMQLTQFLLEKRFRSSRRSVSEKFDQMGRALKLEKSWTKEQVLETYLNLISFRGEIQGLRAASKGLFNKEPHGLNELESSVLAVLIRAPNATPEKVAERACALVTDLRDESVEPSAVSMTVDLKNGSAPTKSSEAAFIAQPKNPHCHKIQGFVQDLFSTPYSIVPARKLAPVVATQLLSPGPITGKLKNPGKAPRTVKSTLDARLQMLATELLRTQLSVLKKQNARDGAVVVLDNATGEILAYVANGGAEFSSAAYVDGVLARRQAGSTLKPFIYGLAFEKRILTPESKIDDSPADFDVGSSSMYRPRNYDNRFHGLVSARDSLGSSLNVPAVKVLLLTGVPDVVERMHRLGFTDLEDGDFYGPSLALGTVDVSLLELTNAYRALARGGVFNPTRLAATDPKKTGRRVFTESASFLVSNVLSDREARSLSFGLESPLATKPWTAVKTGTSKDMRDNWCIGYSTRYTVGVWVGNFAGQPMWNVSGVSGAAPVWLELMTALEEGSGLSRPPQPPLGVVKTTNGKVYLEGTQPQDGESFVQAKGSPRITYPVDQMIMAVDPDIPPQFQRVAVSLKEGRGLRVFLNGKDLSLRSASADLATDRSTGLSNEGIAEEVYFSPAVGSHLLELKTEQGVVRDQVRFEVR